MEIESAVPKPPNTLSRRLSVVAARERGVGPDLVRSIGTDPDIFDAFYREHVERVQRFVACRLDDRNRTADLTAEIFLAAIDAAPRYRAHKAPPKAWLLGIARVIVASDVRQGERRRRGEERLRGSTLLDEDDAARLDARIDAVARSRELYAAMERLPEGERAVLELVAIDELSLKEAAAATGLRPVAARVRLHRARRKLRAELDAVAIEPNPHKEDQP